MTVYRFLRRKLRALIEPAEVPPGPLDPQTPVSGSVIEEFVALGNEAPEGGSYRHADGAWAQANLAANLEEQALRGLQDEVLDLIRENFHAEGTYLICNHCDQVVTWVTKHMSARHGWEGEVWHLPTWDEAGQQW